MKMSAFMEEMLFKIYMKKEKEKIYNSTKKVNKKYTKLLRE